MPLIRIKYKIDELLKQAKQCLKGIKKESNWPDYAPPAKDMAAAIKNLEDKEKRVESLKTEMKKARADCTVALKELRNIVFRVDEVTDGLFGSHDKKKANFGIPPRSERKPFPPVKKVKFKWMEDGDEPGSIRLRWYRQNYVTAYRIEWFEDPKGEKVVGGGSATRCKYHIKGLVPAKQYWIRVCAIRGAQEGEWSDLGTRVARV